MTSLRSDGQWHGFVKMTSHFIGDRLPDSVIANVLDIVQRIVEHPVSLGAESGPIGGVERIGGS